jgi:hypothetical protein
MMIVANLLNDTRLLNGSGSMMPNSIFLRDDDCFLLRVFDLSALYPRERTIAL